METDALKELERGKSVFWVSGCFFYFCFFHGHCSKLPQFKVSLMSCLCWPSVQAGGWTGCLCSLSGSSFSVSVSERLLLKQCLIFSWIEGFDFSVFDCKGCLFLFFPLFFFCSFFPYCAVFPQAEHLALISAYSMTLSKLITVDLDMDCAAE